MNAASVSPLVRQRFSTRNAALPPARWDNTKRGFRARAAKNELLFVGNIPPRFQVSRCCRRYRANTRAAKLRQATPDYATEGKTMDIVGC
jgi:hypothetical protein